MINQNSEIRDIDGAIDISVDIPFTDTCERLQADKHMIYQECQISDIRNVVRVVVNVTCKALAAVIEYGYGSR